MIRNFLVSLAIVLGLTVSLGPVANAAQVDVFKEVCRKNPTATACQEKRAAKNSNPIYGQDGILTKVINILSIIVGIAAVLGIMAAGLRFITSGSNPQQVTVAREMVLYAVVGLIVAALAQLLIRFVLSKL
jgi:hypothetical protein